MICKKCGQAFEDGFNNCPNCGESVSSKKSEKKPITKKWWFWVIIALVIIALLGSLASGGDSEETTAGDAEKITTVGSVAEETTENETADENVYKVGDVLNDNGLEITYVSAEKWTGYNQYSAPKSGSIIVRLYFEAKNNGTSDRLVSSFDFTCYCDDIAAEQYYLGDDDISLTLSAGRSGKGSVYFEVPEDAEKIEVEYEVNVWTDKKAVFIVEL